MSDGIGREIDELRAENARLKERNETLAREGGEGGGRARWRRPLAVTLLVLGGLLLALAVPAVWASRTLLDTDRYTETVAPLANDPAIRASVAVTAVDRLFARADVEARVAEALPPRAAFAAPGITSELRSVSVGTAERALASSRFQTLWTEVNRRAHQRIVPALLSGQGQSESVSVEEGTVSVDLTTVVANVKQALADRGITIVQNVPDDVAGGNVTLFQSDQLGRVQTALRTLQSLSIALPILALVALAGAVLVAPDRRRALLWLGMTAVLTMLVLGIGLALLRDAYVSAPPAGILSQAAAVSLFDTLARFLRNAIRTVAAIGLVLMIGASLAGPSRAAVALRSGVTGGMSALGWDLGRPAMWTDRHRRALDVAIVVIAAIVLFATDAPTAGLVLGLAIAVLVGMLLVELLAHAHPGPSTYPGQPVA